MNEELNKEVNEELNTEVNEGAKGELDAKDIKAPYDVARPAKKKVMEYTEYGDPNKRPTWIRVVCIIAVVLLAGLIIATLIAAILGASKETIMALILCDGIIPIFIWVFLKITQRSLDRRKEAEKYYGQNQN